MPPNGVLAGDQFDRDVTVRLAGRDEAEYLHLAHGQPAGRSRALPGERLHPGKIRSGAELTERPARGIKLHGRGVTVAKLPASEADEHPGSRRLVGRFDLLPG